MANEFVPKVAVLATVRATTKYSSKGTAPKVSHPLNANKFVNSADVIKNLGGS